MSSHSLPWIPPEVHPDDYINNLKDTLPSRQVWEQEFQSAIDLSDKEFERADRQARTAALEAAQKVYDQQMASTLTGNCKLLDNVSDLMRKHESPYSIERAKQGNLKRFFEPHDEGREGRPQAITIEIDGRPRKRLRHSEDSVSSGPSDRSRHQDPNSTQSGRSRSPRGSSAPIIPDKRPPTESPASELTRVESHQRRPPPISPDEHVAVPRDAGPGSSITHETYSTSPHLSRDLEQADNPDSELRRDSITCGGGYGPDSQGFINNVGDPDFGGAVDDEDFEPDDHEESSDDSDASVPLEGDIPSPPESLPIEPRTPGKYINIPIPGMARQPVDFVSVEKKEQIFTYTFSDLPPTLQQKKAWLFLHDLEEEPYPWARNTRLTDQLEDALVYFNMHSGKQYSTVEAMLRDRATQVIGDGLRPGLVNRSNSAFFHANFSPPSPPPSEPKKKRASKKGKKAGPETPAKTPSKPPAKGSVPRRRSTQDQKPAGL